MQFQLHHFKKRQKVPFYRPYFQNDHAPITKS